MRPYLQESAANLTPALEGVCRDSNSFRRWFGGQPQFSFHAPTSLSEDQLDAVKLFVAVSTLKPADVGRTHGMDL